MDGTKTESIFDSTKNLDFYHPSLDIQALEVIKFS